MLRAKIIDASLSRIGRAFRSLSEALSTLAFLLDPEPHPEVREEPFRASYDPLEDDGIPGYPGSIAPPVVIPPEAEQMIAKPNSPAVSSAKPHLAGSLQARMDPWFECLNCGQRHPAGFACSSR